MMDLALLRVRVAYCFEKEGMTHDCDLFASQLVPGGEWAYAHGAYLRGDHRCRLNEIPWEN